MHKIVSQFILTVIFFLCFLNLYAQDKKKSVVPKSIITGTDLLGRPIYPGLGVLPIQNFSTADAEILKYFNIVFKQSLEGNAWTPYGVVMKDKFYAVKDYVSGMSQADFRKYYWFEGVPVEYLVSVSLNSFQLFQPEEYSGITSNGNFLPTICKVNFAVDFVDVASSSILFSKNIWLSSQSKPNPNFDLKADSASALKEMYAQIKSMSKSDYQRIAGVGQIDSLYEIKKEKAKVVCSNPVQIITTRNMGENFYVYSLIKNYSSDSYYFNQTENIGRIAKNKGYTVRLNNLEVEDGEEEIYEAFNKKTPLLISHGKLPPSAKPANINIPAILIDTFESLVKTKANPAFYQSELTQLLSQRTQFFNIVNRSSFNDIEIEKSIQKQLKKDITQAGVTKGADYILQAKIINSDLSRTESHPEKESQIATVYNMIKDKPVVKNEKPKLGSKAPAETSKTVQAAKDPPPPPEASYNLFTKIEFKLVSVETGAIIWTNVLAHEYSKKYPLERNEYQIALNTSEFINEAINDYCQKNLLRINGAFINKYPILNCARNKKGIPERLLLGGGEYAGFRERHILRLVFENEIVVDGKKLKREEDIGYIISTKIHPEVSEWKIEEGEEALNELLKKGAKVYCKFKFD